MSKLYQAITDEEFLSTLKVRKLALEKLKFFCRRHISDSALKYSLDVDVLLEGLVVDVVKEIMCAKIGHKIISYPENWKEAFKERWFPEWAKKRWPVKYKIFDAVIEFPKLLEEMRFCPELFPSKVWHYNYLESRED